MAAARKRRRVPKAGACDCDRVTTAHSVRKLRPCGICRRPGIKLVRIQNAENNPVHPRCVFYWLPLREARYQLAKAFNAQPEAFCAACLGDYTKDIFDLAARLKRGEDVPEIHT